MFFPEHTAARQMRSAAATRLSVICSTCPLALRRIASHCVALRHCWPAISFETGISCLGSETASCRQTRSRFCAGAGQRWRVKGWRLSRSLSSRVWTTPTRYTKRKPSQSRSRSLSRRSLSGLFRSLRSRSSRPDMPSHAQSWCHTALASPGSFPTRSTLSLGEIPVCPVCFGGSRLRTRRCPDNFRAQAAQACPGTALHQAS